ncbi:MAG TPA: glutamine amidotransferase, partial [Phycisphaerales bacterium]|nr:glutamine amidotransferase [Phycisphaerales bacterium]
MKNATSTLKILLIQVRADNLASKHERDCVIEMTGLQPDQVDFVNVAMSPGIDAERLERADAVIIGGSGSHSVVNDDPFTELLIDDVRRIRDRRQPLFGTCWGHQFIARALGGEVVTDLERAEVGVVTVTSTPASV